MVPSADSLLIWGGGGHGKVVADLVRSCGGRVIGFVDRDAAKQGRVVEPGGAVVVAGEPQLLDALVAGTELPGGATAVVVAFGDNGARRLAADRLGSQLFRPLVHPTATVSPSPACTPAWWSSPRPWLTPTLSSARGDRQ